MSAFAVVYEYSNAPVDPAVLERVMERLSQRGPDGRDVLLSDHAALGHWHFWTTPEELGERQPLEVAGMPYKIVLDGRLDNRSELIARLDLSASDGSRLSDAALVLHAYEKWGEDCFTHFIGPFALAILDERAGELLCGRDALGDRGVFYAIQGTRLVMASESWAVAGADGTTAELNEKAVANYFAVKANEDGQTLFKNVNELLPAHVMKVDASGHRIWRYWKPDLSAKLRGRSDQEYAERFLSLLEESVRCRMRSSKPVGVLMSGGLDSTSVACLASRMIVPQKLKTISYVFDELPDCDERVFIKTVIDTWGIQSIQIPSDDLWPYKNLQDWPHNPNQPDGNLYRMVMERTYQRANREDLRVLLTGTYGDELYDGEEDWLYDLITEGRLRDAVHEINLHLRYTGLRRTWESAYLRRSIRHVIHQIPARKNLLDFFPRRSKQIFPAWLTPFSTESLSEEQHQFDPAYELKKNLLGSWTAGDCVNESYYTSCYGLELRHPYRDRRLVEYVLTLPAHQLYNHGQYKHVLRTAMQGILPEAIRTRSRPTTLHTLFARGMERERKIIQEYILDSDAAWRKYVRADWLKERWNIPVTIENDGVDKVVAWLCVSYARWYQTYR